MGYGHHLLFHTVGGSSGIMLVLISVVVAFQALMKDTMTSVGCLDHSGIPVLSLHIKLNPNSRKTEC